MPSAPHSIPVPHFPILFYLILLFNYNFKQLRIKEREHLHTFQSSCYNMNKGINRPLIDREDKMSASMKMRNGGGTRGGQNGYGRY